MSSQQGALRPNRNGHPPLPVPAPQEARKGGSDDADLASAHHALTIFPVRLAQGTLEDLAGARQRQRLAADLDRARTFVAGDAILAEGDQAGRIDLRAGLEYDGRVDLLAPLLARDAEHRALRDGRV